MEDEDGSDKDLPDLRGRSELQASADLLVSELAWAPWRCFSGSSEGETGETKRAMVLPVAIHTVTIPAQVSALSPHD